MVSKRSVLGRMIVVSALALGACSNSGDRGSTPDTAATATTAVEPPTVPKPSVDDYDDNAKNLSVIDGEGDSDLRAVQQRSSALDVLEKKCPDEARSRLADYATVAKQESAKEGVDITTLQALRGVNKSIPPSKIGNVKCQDQFVAYIALVVSGLSP